MPSFDVVSEVDLHELSNAVDQANREIDNRFDFKGTDARIERSEELLTLEAQNEFQIKQMSDILHKKLGDVIELPVAGRTVRLLELLNDDVTPVLIVAGTAMNAGKTTAAARLIKGLQRAGLRVGAAKVTGTGAGGD